MRLFFLCLAALAGLAASQPSTHTPAWTLLPPTAAAAFVKIPSSFSTVPTPTISAPAILPRVNDPCSLEYSANTVTETQYINGALTTLTESWAGAYCRCGHTIAQVSGTLIGNNLYSVCKVVPPQTVGTVEQVNNRARQEITQEPATTQEVHTMTPKHATETRRGLCNVFTTPITTEITLVDATTTAISITALNEYCSCGTDGIQSMWRETVGSVVNTWCDGNPPIIAAIETFSGVAARSESATAPAIATTTDATTVETTITAKPAPTSPFTEPICSLVSTAATLTENHIVALNSTSTRTMTLTQPYCACGADVVGMRVETTGSTAYTWCDASSTQLIGSSVLPATATTTPSLTESSGSAPASETDSSASASSSTSVSTGAAKKMGAGIVEALAAGGFGAVLAFF